MSGHNGHQTDNIICPLAIVTDRHGHIPLGMSVVRNGFELPVSYICFEINGGYDGP